MRFEEPQRAAAFFYRTLHYVYYREEIDDIIVMHDKLRCLDGELMLLLDGTHIGPRVLLPTLQGLKKRFPFDHTVNILPPVLETTMDAVQRLGGIVGRLSDLRLTFIEATSIQLSAIKQSVQKRSAAGWQPIFEL